MSTAEKTLKAGTENKVHEPLVRIVKRAAMPFWQSWLIRIAGVVAALIAAGFITYFLTGKNPLAVYTEMISSSFGSPRRIWNLLYDLAMLLCVSLAVTPAFKMRFWNIGAEGQVLAGGLAAAICMMFLTKYVEAGQLKNWVLIVIICVASIAAGALWGLIPAVFKAFWNTNETLFTLMMNYIAIQIASYYALVMSGPNGSGSIGIINQNSHIGWLPTIGNNDKLLTVIVVLVLTGILFVYLKFSKHGYEIAVVGESEKTAKYIGVNVKKVILRTMILSGAICGLAGLLLVAGMDHSITSGTAGGRGFTAIMVSWLAKFNPLLMILTSFILVFLQNGASDLSMNLGLNESYSDIVSGIIIFFIIGSEFFINYRIIFRRAEKKEVEEKK